MAIKILDLFAGVGGLSLGFELVKNNRGKSVFEVHRAVEIDKYACETLRKRYGKERVIEGDITEYHTTKRIIDECKNKVSIIIGGIPCQSFSLIGPRSGFGKKIEKFKIDKRDSLYEHFKDIVAEIKPNVIVIENVKGILSKKDSKNKKVIEKLLTEFEKLGYTFKNENNEKWQVLNAADFGVPQRRERVIIIGIKKSWKNVKSPIIYPTHSNQLKHKSKKDKVTMLLPYVSVYDAIGDLPTIKSKITLTGLNKKQRKHIRENNKKINDGNDLIEMNKKRLAKHLSKISNSGKKFFKFIRTKDCNCITHHKARSQQISDIKLFGLMAQGETANDFMKRMPAVAKSLIKYNMMSFKDKYRRQNANEPSTTIFAHLEKDGNRFIHPTQARTYTPREAARIQSFPDDFVFEGPMSKKFKQIGNAVPPLLAYNIALYVNKLN